MSEIIDLAVCVICKARPKEGEAPIDPEYKPGAVLHAHLQEKINAAGLPVRLSEAQCLSVCKRACTIAVSAPNKWAYVIGDLEAESAADGILSYIKLYAETPDGVVPFADRPEAVKGKNVARVPYFSGRGSRF